MAVTVADDIITLLETLGWGERYGRLVRQTTLDGRNDGGQYILVRDLTDSRPPESLSKTSFHSVSITVAGGPGEQGAEAAGRASASLWRDLDLVLDQTINGTLYPCIADAGPIGEQQGTAGTYYSWDLNIIRYYGE